MADVSVVDDDVGVVDADVSVVDVLAMDPTKRQELIQQLPALLAVCEIIDGFDPGAERAPPFSLLFQYVFAWLS